MNPYLLILFYSYLILFVIIGLPFNIKKKETIKSKFQGNIYIINEKKINKYITLSRNFYILNFIYSLLFIIFSLPVFGWFTLFITFTFFLFNIFTKRLKLYKIKIDGKDILYSYKKEDVIINVDEVIKMKYRMFRREFVLIDIKSNKVILKVTIEYFNELLNFLKKNIPQNIIEKSIRLYSNIVEKSQV